MDKADKKILFSKDEKSKIVKNWLIFILFIGISVAIIYIPSFKKEDEKVVDFSGVDKICELATLRCYYHNVARLEEQPDGLFKYGLFKYGYKKLWMEYDGIVEIGIDTNEVEVHSPDENGVVKVYVPDARVMNVTAIEDSMQDPVYEKGVLTKITTEEQTKAFADAQTEMEKSAEQDASIFKQAHNNAKKLLEQYVIEVGEQIGENYSVEWIEKAE